MSDGSEQTTIDQLATIFERLDELAPPIELDEVVEWASPDQAASRSRTQEAGRRRRLVGVAAACVAAIGAVGMWWAIDRDTGPRVVPLDGPGPAEVDPWTESTTAPSPIPDPAVVQTIVGRVSAMDAWSAAQLFQVDAQYRASPAQAADLVIANELESRDCYERQGIDLPPFDPGRLADWQSYEQERWDLRRRVWTPDGQRNVREQGNTVFRAAFGGAPPMYPHETVPAPEQCYPAATAVTYLGGVTVWSEERLQSVFESGDLTSAPTIVGAFGRLPGTEEAKRESDECVVGRGWERWTEPSGGYQELFTQPEVSETEIDLMNDVIDCYNRVGAPTIYLTASVEYVNDFRIEFADELAAVASERADALTEAYAVLRGAGLDPLSD